MIDPRPKAGSTESATPGPRHAADEPVSAIVADGPRRVPPALRRKAAQELWADCERRARGKSSWKRLVLRALARLRIRGELEGGASEKLYLADGPRGLHGRATTRSA